MSNILSKSPYIIEISDVLLEGGKIDIYIWKEGSATPTVPQYTLSKLTPASNVYSIYFDIAPYVNEFITNKSYIPNISTNDVSLTVENYCNVLIYAYKLIGGVYVYFNFSQIIGFKGYIEQKDGINIDYGNYLLDQKSYNYYYDSANPTANPPGDITLYLLSTYTVKYTDLKTGTTYSYSVAGNGWHKIYRVYSSFIANGNKVEIKNGATVLASYNFNPIEECRYTPVTLDFINKYGAWQREYLFKNSTDTINVEGQSYKNYRAIPNVFNAQENIVTTFNTNGNETIKCNTGFVEENFKDTIKQLLLSDRILINNRPATITTKQVELQKNINNKLINYSFDFQFTNSII
jgi:hypothetical protein